MHRIDGRENDGLARQTAGLDQQQRHGAMPYEFPVRVAQDQPIRQSPGACAVDDQVRAGGDGASRDRRRGGLVAHHRRLHAASLQQLRGRDPVQCLAGRSLGCRSGQRQRHLSPSHAPRLHERGGQDMKKFQLCIRCPRQRSGPPQHGPVGVIQIGDGNEDPTQLLHPCPIGRGADTCRAPRGVRATLWANVGGLTTSTSHCSRSMSFSAVLPMSNRSTPERDSEPSATI